MSSMNETKPSAQSGATEIKELYPGFRREYELAKAEGERRFGSPCNHEHVSNGICTNCLRRIYTGKP
jgi:hypothetical protein